MPLDFNVGELAGRARRALGIRGRIPFSLDETAVPVVRVFDATESPWRLTGVRAYGSAFNPASVGNFSNLELVNGGLNPCIVNRIQIFNQNAAAQTWSIYPPLTISTLGAIRLSTGEMQDGEGIIGNSPQRQKNVPQYFANFGTVAQVARFLSDVWDTIIPAGGTVDQLQGYTLQPGCSLMVVPGAQNQINWVNFDVTSYG